MIFLCGSSLRVPVLSTDTIKYLKQQLNVGDFCLLGGCLLTFSEISLRLMYQCTENNQALCSETMLTTEAICADSLVLF